MNDSQSNDVQKSAPRMAVADDAGLANVQNQINILLVDDESRNLDVLESILTSPDLRLVRAKTPDEALLALMHNEFACIVLDVQMPTMNGIDLARLIKTRKRTKHVPIIFLTAFFQEETDVLQGYNVGAVDYLTKPVNPDILKSKVKVFLDLFRTTHALGAANLALENEIAQRKKAEEALRVANVELEERVEERTSDLGQSEQRYRQLAAIVESSDDAIIGKDLNGVITSWNDSARRIFGYTAAEIIGKPVLVLIPEERRDEEPKILDSIRRGEPVHHYETIRRRKDGTLIEISLTVSPVKNAEGKIIGASKIARDISERKRAEKELKKAHEEVLAASRAKDEFLAMLSHELRTPLNPVLLIASDAVNNRELPPRTRADFDTIRKNVEMEARLIDDLLDLMRITRGKINLDNRCLNVHRVLEDAVGFVQEELNQKNISLKTDLKAATHAVFADAVRLQQIFWNLLKNAVKFTPNGGQITVESTTVENCLVIKITDTGIGMAPEEVGRIFRAFSQGDHARESEGHRFGGLGLGLAISQKLVEFHSGKILAMSDGRDKGSTFIVELPLAKMTEAGDDRVARRLPPDSAEALPVKKNGIRVLLVEDHEPTRSALTQLLTRRLYKVIPAATIAEARSLAAAQDFNLVVSDIGLPDGNGYDLMAELQKKRAVKGIALTGFGMEQDVARSRDVGFVAHLTKPVSIQSLESALNAACSG